MNQSDRDRILAFGPRNYEEAKFVCDEFAVAAQTCLAAGNVRELSGALKRLDLVRPWLPAWLRCRDQEIERLSRVTQPIMIHRNLSTPENREFGKASTAPRLKLRRGQTGRLIAREVQQIAVRRDLTKSKSVTTTRIQRNGQNIHHVAGHQAS